MDRREFVKQFGSLAAISTLGRYEHIVRVCPSLKSIEIEAADSTFERENLVRPFGIKGGYLTELWQTVSRIESTSGHNGLGVATQSVLYGDDDLFAAHSESGGNALMHGLTDTVLQMLVGQSFRTPIELVDSMLPEVVDAGKRITGKENVNLSFILNSLVSIDNALWLLYAAENNCTSFEAMIPDPYRDALSHRLDRVAVMVPATYGMPVDELVKTVQEGFFVVQVKTGHPGSQNEMLEADMERFEQIHNALKDVRVDGTEDGKVVYIIDPNARYEKRETLNMFLDYAKSIGAFDQILMVEDPLHESNDESVEGMGVSIAADDNLDDEEDALEMIERGYDAFVLKSIAKTLSLSLKIARIAQEHGLPCICGDLTVNPILIDWNKNMAARLAPFPELGMGILATNGHMNYQNWEAMAGYHPAGGSSWTKIKNGVFELDDEFYQRSGGIFEPSAHYEALFKS